MIRTGRPAFHIKACFISFAAPNGDIEYYELDTKGELVKSQNKKIIPHHVFKRQTQQIVQNQPVNNQFVQYPVNNQQIYPQQANQYQYPLQAQPQFNQQQVFQQQYHLHQQQYNYPNNQPQYHQQLQPQQFGQQTLMQNHEQQESHQSDHPQQPIQQNQNDQLLLSSDSIDATVEDTTSLFYEMEPLNNYDFQDCLELDNGINWCF